MHPDWKIEKDHLQATKDIIETELAKLETETGVGAEEERVVAVPQGADDQEIVMLNILRMKLQMLHQLALARRQPYFCRLDFIPEGGAKQIYYLGRWGVTPAPDFQVEVVDWRSPLANLYYSGQVGPMAYEAPDGRVAGELTLKRMFTIHQGELEAIFDTGVVGQEAYLQSVLGQMSSSRLREIVTTIQAEQNRVIRHPLQTPLIVQGVAGSGKTTIALHRIAWLLYAYRETLRPDQMMILAPTPLFLNYISQVLPDLGVEQVVQTTFQALCAQWLGKAMPKLTAASRLEDKLAGDAGEQAALGRLLRRKGSLAFKAGLEDFLKAYEQRVIPAGGLRFGQTLLYDEAALRHIFLVQLKPFPLAKRVQEMKKYVKARLKETAGEMARWVERTAQEKLERLLAALPDGEERRARARRLLDSRDERLAQIKARQSAYLKEFASLWPDLSPLAVYEEFLSAQGLPLPEKGRCQPEDLPPLAVIARWVEGIPFQDIRHVVIDECQDFSPFQIQLLKELPSAPTFTLVGDLMQGIHAQEGIESWEELLGPVFEGRARLCQLVTSYRNTVEIMAFASRVAASFPVPGQLAPQPVLRHGEAVGCVKAADEAERIKCLARLIKAWQAKGYRAIALIEKTQSQAKALHRALSKEWAAELVTDAQQEYRAGVMILPAALVKGMEFDCVALCQGSAGAWPADSFLCRLLYVCLTRPLHELQIVYTGELSPLISCGEKGMQSSLK